MGDPVEIMWHAYNSTAVLGSSTALVLVLDSKTSTIETANLGDSAFRHIRDNAICTRSKVGQVCMDAFSHSQLICAVCTVSLAELLLILCCCSIISTARTSLVHIPEMTL